MREKLALLIALGSFATVVVIGSTMAAAQVNLPSTDGLPCAVDLDPSDPDCDTVLPAPEVPEVTEPAPTPTPVPVPEVPDTDGGSGGGGSGGGSGGSDDGGSGGGGGLDSGGTVDPGDPIGGGGSGGVGTGDGNEKKIRTDDPGKRKP